jgi:hypothetical protein
MPRTWTPEQRQELAERMRQAHAARQEARADNVNPIANDVVIPPVAIAKPHRLQPAPSPAMPKSEFSAESLIKQLEAIPLATVTYSDCGLLLNALSAASTGVALARRQRQEQLEAGSQRAICKTCGRTIDISKSGGFQILTERDEHHMPRNGYYCSQNCLLARNMPSHARQTPKEKRENRA